MFQQHFLIENHHLNELGNAIKRLCLYKVYTINWSVSILIIRGFQRFPRPAKRIRSV